MVLRILRILLASLLFSAAAVAKTPVPVAPPALKPWNQNAFDFETGTLWKVGGDTIFNYRIVPFMLSWRTKEVFGMHFNDGSALVLRHKFTAMANWFEKGSENRYLGLSASPSIEWWDSSATWSIFGGAGGGIGWVDAQGVPGGMGQNFTLNWFGQLGVSRVITQDWSVRASAMFQHHSNGGATNPNPGLNALGFLIGVSRSF